MIRTREWKYIHRYPYGPHELFNLADDPDETRNRVNDAGCACQVAALRARLGEWFERYVDPTLDGARQPVSGLGQLNLVRTASPETAFAPPNWASA